MEGLPVNHRIERNTPRLRDGKRAEWAGARKCDELKTVHAPALSSLDTLHGDVFGLRGSSEREAILAGLGYGNLPGSSRPRRQH